MRKQIIKILEKQPPKTTHNATNYHLLPDNLTYLTDKLESSTLFIHLSHREEIELEKLKNSIGAASPRQKELLLSKVKAVQRVSTSNQKQQQQSKHKRIIHHQSSPKLARTTDSFANYHQIQKGNLEDPRQGGRQGEKLKRNYQQLLEMQIELLNEELNAIKKEKEAISNYNLSLKFENERLRTSLAEKDADLTNLQKTKEETQKQTNTGRIEQQSRIQNLAAENEVLRNEYYKMIDKLSPKMMICSQNVRLSIAPNSNTKIDHKGRNPQLELFNIEKKYAAIITQLKMQHEEEMQKLRKTMFDSVNYYRDPSKKNTGATTQDKYRELQQQLATGLGTQSVSLKRDAGGLSNMSEQKGGK